MERCFNCNRIKDHATTGTDSPAGWLCTYCQQQLDGHSYIRHNERNIERLESENFALRHAILQIIERDARGSA